MKKKIYCYILGMMAIFTAYQIQAAPEILTIDIYKGWNIISSPLERSLYLSEIANSCELTSYNGRILAWTYDPVDGWIQSTAVKKDEGVYILSRENCTVKLIGTAAVFSSRTLKRGWNLISAEKSFAEIQENCQMPADYKIWTLNPQNQEWLSLAPTDKLNQAKGYWVAVENNCTLVNRGRPNYTYRILGAETTREFSGILGSISVHDPSLPEGEPQHFVASLTVLDGPITMGGNGIEVGWIKCNYSEIWGLPCDKPIIFTANSDEGLNIGKAKFFPEYPLKPGRDYTFAITGSKGNFIIWLLWDNQWVLLDAVKLPFEKANVRQSWEVLGPEFEGILSTYFGRSAQGAVFLQADSGWQLWDSTIPTKELNIGGVENYYLKWLKPYWQWLVETK